MPKNIFQFHLSSEIEDHHYHNIEYTHHSQAIECKSDICKVIHRSIILKSVVAFGAWNKLDMSRSWECWVFLELGWSYGSWFVNFIAGSVKSMYVHTTTLFSEQGSNRTSISYRGTPLRWAGLFIKWGRLQILVLAHLLKGVSQLRFKIRNDPLDTP